MTPMAKLVVEGTRASVEIEAMIDTGFNGHVILPIEVAVRIGLELIHYSGVELAEGTKKRELVFAAKVRFLEAEKIVSVYPTESDTPLIGTALLADCELNIDFPAGKVNISRRLRPLQETPRKKSPQKRKRNRG